MLFWVIGTLSLRRANRQTLPTGAASQSIAILKRNSDWPEMANTVLSRLNIRLRSTTNESVMETIHACPKKALENSTAQGQLSEVVNVIFMAAQFAKTGLEKGIWPEWAGFRPALMAKAIDRHPQMSGRNLSHSRPIRASSSTSAQTELPSDGWFR